MVSKELGERIKQIRLNKGLTMEAFGEKFKTSKGTVNNWEKGRNKPNKENIKAIADFGGLTIDELLHGSLNERIRLAFNNLYGKNPSTALITNAVIESAENKLKNIPASHSISDTLIEECLVIAHSEAIMRKVDPLHTGWIDQLSGERESNLIVIDTTISAIETIKKYVIRNRTSALDKSFLERTISHLDEALIKLKADREKIINTSN